MHVRILGWCVPLTLDDGLCEQPLCTGGLGRVSSKHVPAVGWLHDLVTSRDLEEVSEERHTLLQEFQHLPVFLLDIRWVR